MAGHQPRDSLLVVPETSKGFRGSFQAPMSIDAAAESKMNADLYKAAMLKMCLRESFLPPATPSNTSAPPSAAAPKVANGASAAASKQFSILDESEQAAFCERLTVEVFAPREELVIQGQQHNQNFFIVTQGSVDLVVHHERCFNNMGLDDIKTYKLGGKPLRQMLESPQPEDRPGDPMTKIKRTVLCTKKPGDFFGLHMLMGDPAVHSAVAGDMGVVCLKLTRANKDLFAKEYKSVDQKLFGFLGKGFDRTLSTQLKCLKGVSTDPRFLLLPCMFRLTSVDPGTILFEPNKLEKDRGALQVLMEGSVNVIFRPMGSAPGSQDKLIPVKKGQVFGEVGLGLWLPRNAGAVTTSKCYFLEMSQTDFRSFTEIMPEVLTLFQQRTEEYKIPFDLWSESPMFVDRFVKLVAEAKSADMDKNYAFWRAARAYRVSRVDDPAKITSEFKELAETYFGSNAAAQAKRPPGVKEATVKPILALLAAGGGGNKLIRSMWYPVEKETVASLSPLWMKPGTAILQSLQNQMLYEMFNDPITMSAPIKALNTGCNNPKCIAATLDLQTKLADAEKRAKEAQSAAEDAADRAKELQQLLAIAQSKK